MSINFSEVRKVAFENYIAAKKSLEKLAKSYEMSSAISDVYPGYNAKQLEFGSYDKDNFSVLFVDIRNSTNRAKILGPNKTYLAYHAFFPALAYIIEYHNGIVIDFMGDGIMAVFGGKHSKTAHTIAAQSAGLCGIDIQKAIEQVVNPLIKEDDINYLFSCGVGIDYGDVIVTKIGNKKYYDVKAFGDCINSASKLANCSGGTVLVSSKIKDLWPASKNGLMDFRKVSGRNDAFVVYKKED